MKFNDLIGSVRWDRSRDAHGPATATRDLLVRFSAVTSRDDSLEISGELLRRVTHDVNAVTEVSAPTARVLGELLREPVFRWKADVLSTLDGLQRSLEGWKSVSLFNRSNKWEKHTREALQESVSTARGLLDSSDAETRSMAAQFLSGAAPDANDLITDLIARFAAESDQRARGVLAEAVAQASVRATRELQARAHEWLQSQLSSADAVVRFRVARALVEIVPAEDQELRSVITETMEAGMAAMWPAEL